MLFVKLNMKRLVYLILLLTTISFCGNDKSNIKNSFTVSGKIKNCTEKSLYLNELTTKGLRLIDSSLIKSDGTFSFKGNVTEKTFCLLTFQKGASVFIIDTNSRINLSIDAENPESFGVSGSTDTEVLKKLLLVNNKYMSIIKNLDSRYSQYDNGTTPSSSIQNLIRNEYDSIMLKRKIEMQNFVLSLEKSVVPYFATNFLMPETDYDFLEKVDQKFYSYLSNSKYAKDHHSRLEELRKTAIGQNAPDIIMPDPFGKTISLSSLRGKYVLIDFWASWCKPCRQESSNLVHIYTKFKTRGLEIFSVSLDDNQEAWQKAINDDKLLWTHVSDLQKWNSSVVNTYKIEGIPYTVLIDKEGKIVAKNLRGDALDEKLSDILK